jgi:hypothetical protein
MANLILGGAAVHGCDSWLHETTLGEVLRDILSAEGRGRLAKGWRLTMKEPVLEMIGLTFDVVGAFLLSAEAIKLENLKKLRDRFLVPGYWAALPLPYAGTEPSPDMRWMIRRGPPSTSIRTRAVRFVGSWTSHLLAGLFVWAGVIALARGNIHRLTFWLWHTVVRFPRWISILLGIFAAYCTFWIVWLAGEMVHVTAIRAIRTSIVFFDWLEHKTASGIVGIIGFALIFTGFLVEMWAKYLAL